MLEETNANDILEDLIYRGKKFYEINAGKNISFAKNLYIKNFVPGTYSNYLLNIGTFDSFNSSLHSLDILHDLEEKGYYFLKDNLYYTMNNIDLISSLEDVLGLVPLEIQYVMEELDSKYFMLSRRAFDGIGELDDSLVQWWIKI